MNPGELLTRLSPAERMDMMMKGFRPGNLNDVKKYRRGEQLSLKERVEKAQHLAGEFKDLGGSHEREIALDENRTSIPLEEVEGFTTSTQKRKTPNYREQLNEEMQDYSNSAGRTFKTDDIMTLRKNRQLPQQQKSVQMIANEGFNNAKEYLNAFVINLENESKENSYQLRLNIFKSLKKCLETEGTYKGNQEALNAYRIGVLKAEKVFMNKLQGGTE